MNEYRKPKLISEQKLRDKNTERQRQWKGGLVEATTKSYADTTLYKEHVILFTDNKLKTAGTE